MFAADADDLLQRLVEIVAVEVVQRVDGDHQVEALVRERQFGGAGHLEAWLDLFLGVLDGVAGDVDADDLDARHGLGEIVEDEALAAADVEDAVARLDAVVLDHGVGHLPPAAVVAVAAVAGLAVAVPVVDVPFLGQPGGFGLGKLGHPRHVVALRALVDRGKKIDVSHEV